MLIDLSYHVTIQHITGLAGPNGEIYKSSIIRWHDRYIKSREVTFLEKDFLHEF